MENYYDILGIDRSADQKTIRKAYLKLAKEFHPDTNRNSASTEAEQAFIKIKEAYDTLSDENKKYWYDQTLINGFSSSTKDSYTQYNYTQSETYGQSNSQQHTQQSYTYTPKYYYPTTKDIGIALGIVGIITIFVLLFLTIMNSFSAKTYYNDGLSAYQRHDYRKAIYHFQESLSFDDKNESTHYYLAKILIEELHRYEAGIQFISSAIQFSEHPPLNYFRLRANAYLALENYENCSEDLLFILELEPQNIQINEQLAKLYLEYMHEYSKAIQRYQILNELVKDNFDYVLKLGVAQLHAKNFKEAWISFNKASELRHDNPELDFYVGDYYWFAENDLENACLFWQLANFGNFKKAKYRLKKYCTVSKQ